MSTFEIYSELRQPLVDGDKSPRDVTRDVCRPVEGTPGTLWWVAFLVALVLLGVGVAAVGYLIATGVEMFVALAHDRLA